MKGQPIGDGIFYFRADVLIECPYCHKEQLHMQPTLTVRGVDEMDIEVQAWDHGVIIKFVGGNGVTYGAYQHSCMYWSPPAMNEEDFAAWEAEMDE